MRLAQKWSWKADVLGLLLCSVLTAVMDAVIMTETSGNGFGLLFITIMGAGVGAAVTRWRGPALRRWRCVAVGVFLAQVSLVLVVALLTALLHLLFAHMYIPW
ncbi:hypothetical protein GXW83_17420 [Streptacidiphilus sp. PB12-B1b]|uniref:hypothetical protein n=1 Tax=Streptacidiphilus sp. PB12-B1b TaxID=2705012 RepID=UPI0015F7CD3C|nr:hypothetical protein [Streptacidiphilus sp. PB12-B1b]QMU77220.1 hypothetical protein GXW83_17420 [Streptacidiphilus sp. PB12-B1b]